MSTTIYSANYRTSSISLFHDSDGYYHLIYMIVNKINNKIYIGKHSTKNPYDDYMGSGKAINRSIKKYGLENFEKTILYCFESEDKAYLKESEIVDENFVKRSDTYNMKCGGKGFKSCELKGKKFSKEHNYKISIARIGTKHTQETKNKISESKKGTSAYNKGLKMSQEQKDKLSKSKKGKYVGNKNPMYGRTGANNPKSKAIQKIDKEGNIVCEYVSVREFCELEHISHVTLRNCIKLGILYKNFYYKFKE